MNTTKHILIVEDSVDLQALFRQLFESEGYSLSSAMNGAEALALLEKMPALPAFILLDVMMPVMDGIQFRQAQLRDSRWSHLPVIFMTADANSGAKITPLSPFAVVHKPIRDIDGLLALAAQLTSPA